MSKEIFEKQKDILKVIMSSNKELLDVASEVLSIYFSELALVRSASRMRDIIWGRNLYKFLREFDNLSQKEIDKCCRKLEIDPNYRQKVGENVIWLLDRLDHEDKASLVGKAFKAYIDGYINSYYLQRLNRVIVENLLVDLEKTGDFIKSRNRIDPLHGSIDPHGGLVQSFVNTGLAVKEFIPVRKKISSSEYQPEMLSPVELKVEVRPTHLCILFCRHVLDDAACANFRRVKMSSRER